MTSISASPTSSIGPALSHNVFTLDEIALQLRLAYPDEDVRVRYFTEFRGDGMDPVQVIIYDVVNYFRDEPTLVAASEATYRCLVILQGRNKIAEHELDYMEGW